MTSDTNAVRRAFEAVKAIRDELDAARQLATAEGRIDDANMLRPEIRVAHRCLKAVELQL